MKITSYIKNTIKYIIRSCPIISSCVKKVEVRNSMPIEESHLLDERNFDDSFRKAYDKLTFYCELYAGKGIDRNDIQCFGDIEMLPIITKEDIRNFVDKILVGRRLR